VTCLPVLLVRHERHRFQFEQPRTHQPRQKEESNRREDDAATGRGAMVRGSTIESVSISPLVRPPVVRPAALRHPPGRAQADDDEGRRELSGPVRLEWLVGKVPFPRPDSRCLAELVPHWQLPMKPCICPPRHARLRCRSCWQPASPDEAVRKPDCVRHHLEAD
jgi:hypothetical protein